MQIKNTTCPKTIRCNIRILLPSARHLEERLAVSQSASLLGKQSVSRANKQADRHAETYSLAFFSGRLQLLQQRGTVYRNKLWSSGKTLAQRPARCRSKSPARADRLMSFFLPDPGSNAPKDKLLTHPPAPQPPQNVVSSLRGIEASKSKNRLGDRFY